LGVYDTEDDFKKDCDRLYNQECLDKNIFGSKNIYNIIYTATRDSTNIIYSFNNNRRNSGIRGDESGISLFCFDGPSEDYDYRAENLPKINDLNYNKFNFPSSERLKDFKKEWKQNNEYSYESWAKLDNQYRNKFVAVIYVDKINKKEYTTNKSAYSAKKVNW
jgi:hypothetical protein